MVESKQEVIKAVPSVKMADPLKNRTLMIIVKVT